MKKLFLLLALILMNQQGSIGFGMDRWNKRLQDEKDDEGGDEGGGQDDKKDPPGEGGDKGKKPGADDQKDGKKDDSKFDISTLPQEAQDLIKSLRTENAKKRQDSNNAKTKLDKYEKAFKLISGEDEDEEEPEVKLGKVTAFAQDIQMKNALLEIAYENNVPAEQREYFEFLMQKKLDSLEEGAELSEEELTEVLTQVKGKGKATTSTTGDGGKGGKDKKPGSDDSVTLDQFVSMGMVAKSKLYNEKPELYNALMAEARSKKLVK